MGESKREALRVDFDGQIRLEFHGANVTSDAGLLAYRELDEALGLTAAVEELEIIDPRTGQNTQHTIVAMLRQSVYSRLAGYEDTNDATACALIRNVSHCRWQSRREDRRIHQPGGSVRDAGFDGIGQSLPADGIVGTLD